MEEYLGVGTTRHASGSMRTHSSVTANSKEEALERLKKHFEGDDRSLHAMYDEWEYALSGAIRGHKVWDHVGGFHE